MPLRVLCLIDGPVPPNERPIWVHLGDEAQADRVDYLWAEPPRDRYQKWGKLLSYYPSYIKLGIHALQRCRMNRYDAVLSWESKNAFAFAALRSMWRISEPPHIVAGFTFKGIAEHSISASQLVMKGVTHLTVVSPREPDIYARKLAVRREQISFIPLGWHDLGWYDEFSEFETVDGVDLSEKYVLASGRSSRDYDTFFQAVSGLNARFVVSTRQFAIRHLHCPPNVTINKDMPTKDYKPLMRSACFIVVPLQYTEYAAGVSHIIQAMSAGKAIIATRTPCTEYYIEHGKTGLLVKAGDPRDMQAAIQWLWDHPEDAAVMGMRAKQQYEARFTAEAYWQKHYELMRDIISASRARNGCAESIRK